MLTNNRGCHGRDRIVAGFTTTYTISGFLKVLRMIYNYLYNQCLVTGQWFSPGTADSSTNKTDSHDIAEILFKVVSPTITTYPNH